MKRSKRGKGPGELSRTTWTAKWDVKKKVQVSLKKRSAMRAWSDDMDARPQDREAGEGDEALTSTNIIRETPEAHATEGTSLRGKTVKRKGEI